MLLLVVKILIIALILQLRQITKKLDPSDVLASMIKHL